MGVDDLRQFFGAPLSEALQPCSQRRIVETRAVDESCALHDCLVDQGGRTIEVIFQSDPNRKLHRCSFHYTLGCWWSLKEGQR